MSVAGPGVHLKQGLGCLRSQLLVACQPGKNRNSGLKSNLKKGTVLILYLFTSLLKFGSVLYLHTLSAFILNLVTKVLCVSSFQKSDTLKREDRNHFLFFHIKAEY